MFLKHYLRVLFFGLLTFALIQPTTAEVIEIIPPPPVMGEHSQILYSENQTEQNHVSEDETLYQPEEKNLTADVRLWHANLAGQIDSRGMSLGLVDDTSMGAQNLGSISGSWQFTDKTQLHLDYFKFDHSGQSNRNVTFDSRSYAVGSTIRLRNNIFGLGVSHALSENKEDMFKLLCGVSFSQLNMKIEQGLNAGARTGDLDQKIGMPYLGIEGATRLSVNAGLIGAIKVFDLDKNGEANRISDIDLALEFGRDYQTRPANQEWYGVLGYRYFMLNDESNGNSSRVVYSGPVLGIRGVF